MASTDFMELNRFEMFAKIRAGLSAKLRHSQHIIETKDDLLYAWDALESCLLVLNWRAALNQGHDKITYQVRKLQIYF